MVTEEGKKWRVSVREFLNLPDYHGGAYIIAKVSDTFEETKELENDPQKLSLIWTTTFLEIADCRHKINLEFDIIDEEKRENSLYKLDMLIKTLQDFRRSIKKEIPLVKKREKVRDARSKIEPRKVEER